MIKLRTAQVMVRAMAIHLDAIKPGWHKLVDSATLDIKSTYYCVLAQIYGSYNDAPAEAAGPWVELPGQGLSNKVGIYRACNVYFAHIQKPGGDLSEGMTSSNWEFTCEVFERLWRHAIKTRLEADAKAVAEAEAIRIADAKAEAEAKQALLDAPAQRLTIPAVLRSMMPYVEAGTLGAIARPGLSCRYQYDASRETDIRCVAGTVLNDSSVAKLEKFSSRVDYSGGITTLKGPCVFTEDTHTMLQRLQARHDAWAQQEIGGKYRVVKEREFWMYVGVLREKFPHWEYPSHDDK